MSDDDGEVFFGPVSQEEEILISKYKNRRTEIYCQGPHMNRHSLLEFRQKSCLKKNLSGLPPLNHYSIQETSEIGPEINGIHAAESEDDSSVLESCNELLDKSEDKEFSIEGMSDLRLTSPSERSESTEVNETSFESDSLSCSPYEKDSITEDSLQSLADPSAYSKENFPNASPRSSCTQVNNNCDPFAHSEEIEKHEQNDALRSDVSSVIIPTSCSHNNVGSLDGEEVSTSTEVNNTYKCDCGDSESFECLDLVFSTFETLRSGHATQKLQSSDTECGPPTVTVTSDECTTLQSVQQYPVVRLHDQEKGQNEHDVEDFTANSTFATADESVEQKLLRDYEEGQKEHDIEYFTANSTYATADELDEQKLLRDQECQTSFMVQLVDSKLKTSSSDTLDLRNERSTDSEDQQLQKSDLSKLKTAFNSGEALTPCNEIKKAETRMEKERNKHSHKQLTPGRLPVFKTPEFPKSKMALRPQRVPCTPNGSDPTSLGTCNFIRTTPNLGKGERFKHIVSPVAQYIRKAPPPPLIANSKPIPIKKPASGRKLLACDNTTKSCKSSASKMGTPARIKSKQNSSDKIADSENILDLEMEPGNKENWNVDEAVLKRFGLTLKEFQCMGNTMLKQEVISFIQANQSQVEYCDTNIQKVHETENVTPSLPRSIYLGTSSLAVLQNEQEQVSKVKNKMLCDYICHPTILKHTGQRKIMHRSKNLTTGTRPPGSTFYSTEMPSPRIIKVGTGDTELVNADMSTVDVSIVEAVGPL